MVCILVHANFLPEPTVFDRGISGAQKKLNVFSIDVITALIFTAEE